jgi:hypothetical protein
MVAASIASLEVGDNQHTQICVPSISESAKKLNVSERSVNTAKQVKEKGSPELVAAVESGKVAVSDAVVVVDLNTVLPSHNLL